MNVEELENSKNGDIKFEGHENRVRAFGRQVSTKLGHTFPVNKPLPTSFLLVVFIVLGLLFWLAFASNTMFPTAVKKSQLTTEPMNFNGENAFEYVRSLADIGYRVAGTVNNELLAVNYIKAQIENIIRYKHPDVDIEYRATKTTGTQQRIAKFYSSTIAYIGVQNIVVKLQPKNVNRNLNYILMNSHFDTVPMSPGAGDDATMVGVMLELLRVFSKSNQVRRPLVFLFNGCEENGLSATHAFATRDPWFKKVGILLNLEVTGGGGKEMVFQSNPQHPWLMNSYSKSVPMPYANVVAEELYRTGLIQSDTDYTIFRTLNSKLPAFDFAQIKDCYTYHTKYDDIHNIPEGSLQHTGENLYALIRELDGMSETDNYEAVADDESGDNVYFDYLGWFVIFYKELIGTIVNSILFVVLTIITAFCAYQIKGKQGVPFTTIAKEYGIALVVQLLSMILGVCALLFIAWIFDACGRSMTWYYSTWLLWGLYFCPFNFFNMLLPYAYIKYREKKSSGIGISTSYYTQLALHAQCNIICIILIILTGVQVRSAYMVLISTLFYFCTTLINVIFGFVAKGNKWLYLHCLGQLLPSLYYFYIFWQVYESMIPIRARAYDGTTTNPDLFIALVTAVCAILSTGFWAPIFIMFKHRKYILGLFGSVFVLFVILAITPLGFPFRERVAPQRYTIWHVQRDFYDYTGNQVRADAGYYVYGYDRHGASAVKDVVERFQTGILGRDWCKDDLLCGQPWYRIAYMGNLDNNYWIPAENPRLPTPKPMLKLLNLGGQSIDRTKKLYEFAIAGPHVMSVAISPKPGVDLVEWSLTDTVRTASEWNDRPVYFIHYNQGATEFYYTDYPFNLIFNVPENFAQDYYFDIALGAHFIHDESTKTREFIEFTEAFPKWANVQNWTSYYSLYQYR